MQWIDDQQHGGVRERTGFIVGNRDALPIALWAPVEEPARGLVLIGHGGSGDKREDYVVALARALVRRHALAAVSMDGPVHGDRRGKPGASGVPLLDFAARWSSDAALTDHAVEDWITVLDAIHPEVGTTVPVGYWGLSMGTILGLPFVASEPRVAAAVLGLMGATGPTQDRILRDAATLTIPVFFVLQWDDQLFPRTTALALFDALGTSNKMLVANPGPHAGVPARTFAASADFLADCLLGGV